ncbi:putative glycoside hydrolase [Treponema pectinovorum]|uniref:putative glycoside hydrolase n=1 Tax=Treponema pectinovorum TaxID=164 RepID=UPI0020902DCB|nr:putative glycoside hydrolase [Treponema pectinovorum]
MRIYSLLIGSLMLFSSCVASAHSPNPIYVLPETAVPDSPSVSAGGVVAGASSGLYRLTSTKTAIPLWTESKVLKIIKTSSTDGRWYFLTGNGILTSTDLKSFEYRNSGLPFLKMKSFEGDSVSFSQKPAQLKDLEIHPENPDILVTATKDNVFITYDGGLNWKNLGSMSAGTSGIKAVAVCNIENSLVVFMAHPIFGFSYIMPLADKPVWKDCNGGFENMKGQTYPDEISDICPVVLKREDGSSTTEIYVSQTFLPRLYRFDWALKRGVLLYSGKEPVDTIDGLFWNGKNLMYTRPGEIASLDVQSQNLGTVSQSYYAWKDSFSALSTSDTLYCAWIPEDKNLSSGLSLSELWLLKPEVCTNAYSEKVLNKKSIYCPANHVTTQSGIDRYKKIILENKLNSLVIDMKDDYGLLRYDAKDPLVVEKGYVSKYHINLNHFVSEMKKDRIYLIARIVVFKDKNLSQYAGGKYAVWDKTLNRAWIGTKGMEDVTDENGVVTSQKMAYYDENWVDPYSPEVWEYNVRVAKELIAGGFDEIQFDYIRFPTDGKNMANAVFRWKDTGMDKESALLSFLSYARKNIDAPIGIDIYGANGWYRSGARTGQDVEQLSEYVDVICPMFYPSHFEQDFLNYAPVSERPYRIYYYGSYRNTVIGRNRIIVRPWVQSFYLNVRYDRQWYGKEYVKQQVYGVRDSVDKGYMYWNNIGRYDDISPDVGTTQYTGSAYEALKEFRKPALGSSNLMYPKKVQNENSLSENFSDMTLLDSVRKDEKKDSSNSIFPSISDIRKLWQAYESDKHEI